TTLFRAHISMVNGFAQLCTHVDSKLDVLGVGVDRFLCLGLGQTLKLQFGWVCWIVCLCCHESLLSTVYRVRHRICCVSQLLHGVLATVCHRPLRCFIWPADARFMSVTH